MTVFRRMAVMAVLVLLPLAAAQAAPLKGFGLFGGIVNSSSPGEITKGALDGLDYSLTSSGLSFGLDYQFPITENVTINPFLMTSSESPSSKELDVDSAGHGILGVQARYWFSDFFAGVHAGFYSEALSRKDGDTTEVTSGSGTGFGAAVGWQSPDSGLFTMAQYDSATIAYSDAESNLTGFRFQVGYRWAAN